MKTEMASSSSYGRWEEDDGQDDGGYKKRHRGTEEDDEGEESEDVETASEAASQEHREDFILGKIAQGAPLLGTYPADKQTLAEYEEHCKTSPPPDGAQ